MGWNEKEIVYCAPAIVCAHCMLARKMVKLLDVDELV